jgi:exodeoxyribonuclease V alpha subunit
LQSSWSHLIEKEIVTRLRKIQETPPEKPLFFDDSDPLLKKLRGDQPSAVQLPFTNKLSFISGTPGSGKTTLLNTILALVEKQNLSILTVSPTGKAAQRLSEVTGRKCLTIHRALGCTHIGDSFTHNDINPLPYDFIVLDETGMVNTSIIRHLLRAIKPSSYLLFVGDAEQLIAIGEGAFFRDALLSKQYPSARLNEVLRIEKKEGQTTLPTSLAVSREVLKGRFNPPPNDSGWAFFHTTTDEHSLEITKKIILTLKNKLNDTRKLNELIQVISPIRSDTVGVDNLNKVLKPIFNDNHDKKFNLNDKIIQRVNDYDLDVYNGDVGYITSISEDDATAFSGKNKDVHFIAQMGDRTILYPKKSIKDISLAYALTGHQSQGSEYPYVVVIIPQHHYALMDMNWFYTVLTRCKNKVFVVGNINVVKKITRVQNGHRRKTLLCEKMRLEIKSIN